MSFPDERDVKLLNLVYRANGISTEDEFVVPFSEDRGQDDDTINRCISAGRIKQVGDTSYDNFSLVPWWWPYSSAEQATALRGWKQP